MRSRCHVQEVTGDAGKNRLVMSVRVLRGRRGEGAPKVALVDLQRIKSYVTEDYEHTIVVARRVEIQLQSSESSLLHSSHIIFKKNNDFAHFLA